MAILIQRKKVRKLKMEVLEISQANMMFLKRDLSLMCLRKYFLIVEKTYSKGNRFKYGTNMKTMELKGKRQLE